MGVKLIKKNCFLFLVTIVPFYQSVFASDLEADFLRCVKTEHRPERIACYESLGADLLLKKKGIGSNEDSKVNVAVSVDDIENSNDEVTIIPTDLGGKSFKNHSEGKKERAQVLAQGKVTSCKKAVDGKWFFTFENGQIWKQVGSSRRYYRNCDFLVKIKKDGIGYKLQVDGDKRIVRIKRYR